MMMKPGVLTAYFVNGVEFASYILGSDIVQIMRACQRRGLKEIVKSQITEVETLPDYAALPLDKFRDTLPDILHTACFISRVAINAGTMTVENVLGDTGVVHELSHAIANVEGCNKKSLSCLRDLISCLQKNAIGFYEPV